MPVSRVISFANQKGGVGKTTCVANVGAGLARRGATVLLVDLDPQAHLTASFGYDPDELEGKNVCDILRGDNDVLGIGINPNLSLIPADLSLADVEFSIVSVPGRDLILKNYLAQVDTDYVLIDCPPSLGVLTLNALTASKEVFIPMQAEFLPLRGVRGLVDSIELVKARLNPGLSVTGVIATRVDGRKLLTRSVLDKIGEFFGSRVFNTYIRENIAIAEAPAHGKAIYDYAPESHGAEDFENLVSEIAEMGRVAPKAGRG